MIHRVVMDTSTLVSAALRIDSVPWQALLRAIGWCEVCTSVETLSELERVLARDKFRSYLSEELRSAFVSLVRRNAHLFDTEGASAPEPFCRDSGDQKFLVLALVAEADIVVSSDDDLLVLHPWRGISILTPAQFLSLRNEPG